MIHRPRLTGDPGADHRVLTEALATAGAGTLELPPGTHVIADGLTVGAGWTIRGARSSTAQTPAAQTPAAQDRPATVLTSAGTRGRPLLHVLGSDVSISDLGLRPPPADPGEHGGDRGTAITVGEYLYAAAPRWIGGVRVSRVHVERTDRAANSIALMGAVHDVTLHDVTVRGGYTGVAVHWGAVGADVSSISGPTYHPHHLTVTDLRVRDAVEGFYLSSVHDVRVAGACLRDVQMGFRLLPGDNTDRFAPAGGAAIGARIDITGVCTRWNGDLYGIRVAGWGRSEIDGVVSVLGYTDTVIRECAVTRSPDAPASGSWSPVVMERADGVELRDLRLHPSTATPCCPLATA